MSAKQSNWVPEIFYEETEDGITSHIPFISVPADEVMPKILFMFESRETGENPGRKMEDFVLKEFNLVFFEMLTRTKVDRDMRIHTRNRKMSRGD